MRKRKFSKYQNDKDEKLVTLMNLDHEGAFRELYDRYKDRIFYYFYRMLGNSEQKAQDFLQDLFMKLIEKSELFDPGQSFSTWIFSIAHNMCKNEYRRLERNKLVEREDVPEPAAEGENLDSTFSELSEKIFQSLNDLDEEHKTCFLLKYREGFSVEEISDILEISKGTVKSRLFYTRKKLRQQFEGIYRELKFDKPF